MKTHAVATTSKYVLLFYTSISATLSQFQSNHSICFGEVKYYFQLEVAKQVHTLAMVSVYTNPDENLLKQSSDTLCVVCYRSTEVIDAKSICSVVALIPFILSKEEKQNLTICTQFAQCFFVGKKPFLDFTTTPSQEADEEA